MQINPLTTSPATLGKQELLPSQRSHTTQDAPQVEQEKVSISRQAQQPFEQLAAYPGWADDYIPKVNILSHNLSQQSGHAAWEAQYRSDFSKELHDYNTLFNQHFTETKKDFDITDSEAFYKKVIQAGEEASAFQQRFENKIMNDPQMTTLMQKLGIKTTWSRTINEASEILAIGFHI